MASSEFLIVAGMIIVGILFFMAAQTFITSSGEEALESKYRSEAEELVQIINKISKFEGNVVYEKKISYSNVSVKDGVLIYRKNGYEFRFLVPSIVEDSQIVGATELYIKKENDKIILSEKSEKCNYDFICQPEECSVSCSDCAGPTDICKGDGICNKEIGENCGNSIDCVCEQGKVCCPSSPDGDKNGCSSVFGKRKGEECYCDSQCESGLVCNPTSPGFIGYEKACCEPGKAWDGTQCVSSVCPSTITPCFNNWHWKHYGDTFEMNVFGYTCDYFEVCYDPVVKSIAEEIINCCNNKCSGDCHSYCNKALSDSGLSTTDTPQTRKKCYGLYTIYGLGPAARWLQGYQIHIEEPASIMLTSGTWMCTGYSIVLTTLLRSVGYEKDEVYSTCGPGHAYNLVKFPGESKYRFVDTVGNSLYISGISSLDWYRLNYGACRTSYECSGCMNDVGGHFTCPSPSNIYLGASC